MLADADRTTLLEVAHHAVLHGLQHNCEIPLTAEDYSLTLQAIRASFVTLTIAGDLRGCIGTLEAYQPLVKDVAHNAYAAAFHDPRFQRVKPAEYDALEFHISILSPPEAIHFRDEDDLLTQLQPGTDGLLLEEGRHRGTFLPQVWKSLPEPVQFLRHLKQKAGLPPDYWSRTIRIQRYTVEDF